MAVTKTTKSCLLVTYGPVPTPQYQTVEGGGMRVWGLARGLLANGVDVTIAVNEGFPQELTEHEGVKLVNWGLNPEFVRQLNSYDAVIASYCMGDPSVFIADNINDNIQLVLDAYVPIYVEVSARESKDVEAEYDAYMGDIGRFNRVLRRGDYFLYANDAQELLYTGVLSALGVINPASYRQSRLIKAPFGMLREPVVAKQNPYTALGIKETDFTVLWFGGIYPWFRVQEYLDAIDELSSDQTIKFVFVGGKNPFNPNPDFSRQYDQAVDFAKKRQLINKQVFFVDWVDFDDRVDWFVNADIIVSLNQPGDENKYSWRTRVIDFVWGETATLSNGGDPLSEEMIASDAAIRLPELSAQALASSLRQAKADPAHLRDIRKNVIKLKNKYFWDVATKPVVKIIEAGELPYAQENPLRNRFGAAASITATQGTLPTSSKLRKIAELPIKAIRKIRQKGILRSAKIAASIVKTQLRNTPLKPREPQFVFISHPINNTGAPIVLLQIIEEYVKRYGANRVRVIAPGVEKEQKAHLKNLGVTVEQAVFGVGFRFIRLQLRLQKDDFVLMNTVAIYDNYRDFIMLWLRNGRLKHAYWFIHEDIAQLPIIHKEFLDKTTLNQIAHLAKSGTLDLLLPSRRTATEYNELLGVAVTRTVNLRVEVDKHYTSPKTLSDFKQIDFLLSGTAGDGRKGQVLALSAFQAFIKDYYEKDPSAYRPFKLHLVAVGKTEYISQQIRWISESLMPKQVVLYDSLPKADALDITKACNAVICCSLNETFGLYIAEGMLMGHVLLRNNSAGVDEQLQDGKNGLLIDHTNIHDFAEKIAKLLSKSQTTDKQLLAMSKKSQQIIANYGRYDYLSQIESR